MNKEELQKEVERLNKELFIKEELCETLKEHEFLNTEMLKENYQLKEQQKNDYEVIKNQRQDIEHLEQLVDEYKNIINHLTRD